MKLDNKGWGIKEMFLLTAILLFFFCLAIYFIYIFYDSIDKNVKSTNTYIDSKIENYD